MKGYYKLTSDISINGSFRSLPTLVGTFDDGNHCITINASITSTTSGNYCAGFFSRVRTNGVVKNLSVNYVSGTAVNSAIPVFGGIAGCLNGGTIDNCRVSGTMKYFTLGKRSGGIVGELAYGTIKNSQSDISIYTKGNAGGLVGKMTGGSVTSSTFTGTVYLEYVKGSISSAANNPCVGGFVGEISGGTISGCHLRNYNYYAVRYTSSKMDDKNLKPYMGKEYGKKTGGSVYSNSVDMGGRVDTGTLYKNGSKFDQKANVNS